MPRNGTIGRAQMQLSLALWAAIILPVLLVGLLANFSPIMSNYLAKDAVRHRETNGFYPYTGGYVDPMDYLLLEQLSKEADYSRGGVYFVGASETMISIMPWEMVPAERKLIRNYGIGGLNHREARHFLRCLVEEHDLLRAGGEKTTVILGLSYGMVTKKDLQFKRHGLYTFHSNEGVHRTPMFSFVRFLRVQRVYANRFLNVLAFPTSEVRLPSNAGPAVHQARWIETMGDDWQKEMQEQMHDLDLLIDYLQERNVRVHAVFPPQATWKAGLPFADAYSDMVKPILAKHSVPTTDFRNLLPDEDYGDSSHFNYIGQWKVHRAYREVALKALAEMGTKLEP
jgi:hypothetical protein